MEKIELSLEKREILGKKVSELRERGIVPGVLYGHDFKSLPVQVDVKNFEKAYKEAGESTLVYVHIGAQAYPTIIQDVAIDPVDDHIIHVDFYKVRLDEKITAQVPLVFVGESAAVKDLAGILVKNINEIEVEAFPQDLPHEVEVDISQLSGFEDQILIKNLKVSDKVKVQAELDEVVALVQEPISEEELEKQLEESVAVPEEVEVEVGEKKEDEEAEVDKGVKEEKKEEKAEEKESDENKKEE